MAENCCFGLLTPLEALLALVIDDGVSSRGHRKNIFESWSVVVVGCFGCRLLAFVKLLEAFALHFWSFFVLFLRNQTNRERETHISLA